MANQLRHTRDRMVDRARLRRSNFFPSDPESKSLLLVCSLWLVAARGTVCAWQTGCNPPLHPHPALSKRGETCPQGLTIHSLQAHQPVGEQVDKQCSETLGKILAILREANRNPSQTQAGGHQSYRGLHKEMLSSKK